MNHNQQKYLPIKKTASFFQILTLCNAFRNMQYKSNDLTICEIDFHFEISISTHWGFIISNMHIVKKYANILIVFLVGRYVWNDK